MGHRNPKINRYYMDLPSDRLVTRLKKRLTRRPIPPFPRNIQIQTQTGCNADCIFCPYGATAETQPKGKMEWDLFRKIVDETVGYRVRRISPYLMNEPFADRDLFKRIRYINRVNPKVKVLVTTNGSLLTPPVVEELLDLGDGVHEISISVQGIDPVSYKETMRGGMNFDRTMANVNHLIEEMQRRQIRRPALWITMVDTAVIDARKSVEYWRSRGVNSKYTRLENRGGNIKDAEDFSVGKNMGYFSDCTRLFKQAYIKFNGDVVLCCTDYEATTILGNVREKSLYEVWNGSIATEIRKKFLTDRIGEISLCSDCKVDCEKEVVVRGAKLSRGTWPVASSPNAISTGPNSSTRTPPTV